MNARAVDLGATPRYTGPKMGRVYERQLNIRLTSKQLSAVDKAAGRAGMSTSGWIREVALAAAGATHLSIVGRIHAELGGRSSVDDQIKTVRAVFVSRKRGAWTRAELEDATECSPGAVRAAISQLEEEGLAERSAKKSSGRGRPTLLYTPVKDT